MFIKNELRKDFLICILIKNKIGLVMINATYWAMKYFLSPITGRL